MTENDAAQQQADDKPSRAAQRRQEEFERLCATGYTVCCGAGGRSRKSG